MTEETAGAVFRPRHVLVKACDASDSEPEVALAPSPSPRTPVISLRRSDSLRKSLFTGDVAFQQCAYTLHSSTNMNQLAPELVTEIAEILQDIWSAGKYSKKQRRVELGWIVICHVNTRLRRIILAAHSLWAKQAFTFYNARVIQECLRRAHDAPIHINLRRLESNSANQRYKHGITDIIYSADLFARATSVISNCIKHGGNKVFSERMTAILSTTSFTHLRKLSVCIPSSAGPLAYFSAPQLVSLSLHSDAAAANKCPLSIATIQALVAQAPRLRRIYLARIVSDDTSAPYSGSFPHTTRPLLESLVLLCFEESLLYHLQDMVTLTDDAEVKLDFISPRSLQTAQACVRKVIGLPLDAPYDINAKFKTERSLNLSAQQQNWSTKFMAIKIKYHCVTNAVVTYRLDLSSPTWTWDEFSIAIPATGLHELTLNHIDQPVSISSSAHLLPTALLQHSNSLQSLSLKDIEYMPVLQSITPNCCLRSVTLEFAPAIESLTALTHWLQTRVQSPGRTIVSLRGSVYLQMAKEDYELLEIPILDQLSSMCTFCDHRTFQELLY
ncbi:hypothetical protein PENSPDRAFT_668818 [Peniophora sp. CONT]|nr:hypothetical protein PENSPDRAFT_668818 [Peniophora sp. CONT]